MFYGCTNLTTFRGPGLSRFPVDLFGGCTSFASLVIPDSVATVMIQMLGMNRNRNCVFTSVVIGDSVTTIGVDYPPLVRLDPPPLANKTMNARNHSLLGLRLTKANRV